MLQLGWFSPLESCEVRICDSDMYWTLSHMENFSTNSCIKCGAQNSRSWPERERLRAQACSTRAGPIDNARSFVTSRAARKTEVSNTMRGLMWMEGKKQSVPLNQSNQFLYERKAECLLLLLRCERVWKANAVTFWVYSEYMVNCEKRAKWGEMPVTPIEKAPQVWFHDHL